MTRRTSAGTDLSADPRAGLLRRYFRAVLGDQATGDRLARALWSAPEDAPFAPDAAAVDAASVLLDAMRRWRRLHNDPAPAAAFSPGAIAQALSPAAAQQRQVGVLIDVFGLTVPQTATALDRSEGEVTVLLSAARAAARTPLGCHVLVVEDDPLVAQHLAHLAREGGAEGVSVARGARAAFDSASRARPGIVLCDYDLGEGPNGAEIVRRLASEHDAVCIFVTAYPNAVLSGTDGEPAFIIEKPFRESVVRAALSYAGTAERPVVLAA